MKYTIKYYIELDENTITANEIQDPDIEIVSEKTNGGENIQLVYWVADTFDEKIDYENSDYEDSDLKIVFEERVGNYDLVKKFRSKLPSSLDDYNIYAELWNSENQCITDYYPVT